MVILEFWVFNHSHWQIKKTKQKKHVLTVRTSNCPWIGDLNLLTEWLISIKNDLKHLLISQSIWKIQSFNHNLENRKSKCSRVDLSEKKTNFRISKPTVWMWCSSMRRMERNKNFWNRLRNGHAASVWNF